MTEDVEMRLTAEEAVAEAWASIDGRLDAFRACKADPELERTEGRYGGYMAEARSLIERTAKRGYGITLLSQPTVGREEVLTEFQIKTHPEDHPVLKAILDVRSRASGDFSPQHSGQRGEDFDNGLLAAFVAAQEVILAKANDALLSPGAPGGWRAIETCPKDGSLFLAWPAELEGGHIVAVQAHWYRHPSVEGPVTDAFDCGDYVFEPKLWAPLPEALASEPGCGEVERLREALQWFVDRADPLISEFDLHGPADFVEALKWALKNADAALKER